MSLDTKYTGEVAESYLAKRQHSKKWKLEETYVAELLPLSCKTVLDVPVGTGRFAHLYEKRQYRVTGMDISNDMLKQCPSTIQEIVKKDIFKLTPNRLWDLVVCVRFLNWLEEDKFRIALSKLAKASRQHILLSIAISEDNFVKANGLHVHSESYFRFLVSHSGMKISDTREVARVDGITTRIVLLEH